MKHSKKEYFIIAAIIGILSGAALISAFQIPAGGNLGRGADFMPKIVAGLLLCCAFGFFVMGLLAPKGTETKEGKKRDAVPMIRFVMALGMLLVYVALLKTIGFVIMTALYIFAQSLFMAPPEKRNFLLSGILAIVVSIAIYYVFARGLGMTLPAGLLSDIL